MARRRKIIHYYQHCKMVRGKPMRSNLRSAYFVRGTLGGMVVKDIEGRRDWVDDLQVKSIEWKRRKNEAS